MAAWIVVGVVGGVWLGFLVGIASERKRQADLRQDRALEDKLRKAMQPRDGDKEMLERVLERLLGAVVPEPEKAGTCVEQLLGADARWMSCSLTAGHAGMHRAVNGTEWTQRPQHESEYEEPVEPVLDWTDPFIGLERPNVARLAPGQAIPGLEPVDDGMGHVDAVDAWREQGEGAFEEWARDSMIPEGDVLEKQWESWVKPVRLDDE